MEEALKALDGLIKKLREGDLKRLDIHSKDGKISIYKVTDRLVRIDFRFMEE